MMPSNSPRSEIEMLSSLVAVSFQPCCSQTASSELVELDIHPPKKRKLSDPGTDNVKKNILENEVKKVEILKAIESKMDKFTEIISCKMDHIADSLDILISNQSRLIAMTGNTSSGIQTNPLHPFQPSATQILHAYQQQYFPSLPPFYKSDKD